MTYSQILDVINQNIKQNGNEEITGVVLNSALRALLGFVNDGFITINDVIQILADTKSVDIIGSIGLTTDTTSLPAGVYNTQTSGTYTNASNIVVKEGYYTLLRKLENGTWKLESEVKMPIQDLTDLENRTTALEGRIEPNGNITTGQTARAVNGDKVERYVQRNAFVDFKHSFADKDGYEINSKVFVDNKFWISKVDGNKDYPSKSSTKWIEFKMSEDLENRVNTLDGKIQVAEDDINTLESELNITKDKVTALENKNGGEVEFGNTKNIEGGKVFDYVNNKSITKFNPTAYEGGYPIDALVFHNDNVWKSMVNLNTETPQKGTSRWKEVKFNSDSKITIKDVSQQLPKDYDGDMVPVWNESLKNWSTAFQVRENPLASTIPVRSGDGNLKTDKALQDEDAVSKVNENIVIFNTISEARDYLTKTKYVDFGKIVFVKSEDTYYKVNRDKNDLVTLINESGQLISFFDLNDTPDSGFDAFGKVLKVGENGKIVFENITKDDFDSNTEEGLNVFLWNTETQVWESALATKKNTSYSIAMRGENGVLEVGKAVNDREAINLGQLKDYANPNALIKPEEDGNITDYPYVVGINRDGDTAFLDVNEFGRVDKVMGVAPDANKNVDISGIETNWTNASQRFSGLVDKSADATFNQFALFDSNGNLAKASQIANAFEAGLKNTTAEQGLRIGQLLNGGQGSAGMMSVTSISPPVVEKIDSMEYLLIRGTNLYLNVTSMSIEIVKSSDNITVVKIPNSQIQLYDNGLSLVVGYNFKDLPFGEYKLKITSGVKVLITTLTLRVVENVEHINIDAITWDVVTNSSYDFTNKYTVAGRSLWVKSPFTGVDSNVPIFSAKSSTLFNAGENFVIEFTMNYAAQNNFGSTVHTRFGLTSSDLTNILNYISLAYFNFWCMGGHAISYNIQGVVGDSKSSAISGTLDCKIVKNGNLFTLMIESIIYAVTISNNNNYSFIFQMPDRKFASGGEEDTLLITKAYKYN